MRILYEPDGDWNIFFSNMDSAVAAGARSLFLLSCAVPDFPVERLNRKLQSLAVPVFGGFFPQIIHAGASVERGTLVCAFDVVARVHHVDRLSAPDANFAAQLTRLESALLDCPTMLVLVDGLGRRISEALDAVYDALGEARSYLGGGAGYLDFTQRPCLFSNTGLQQDAVQLVGLPMRSTVAVGHGWHVLKGPYLVTKSAGTVIHELDYRPAFEVYREVVEATNGCRFDQHDFFAIAKRYPFGLKKWEEEVIVRDPIARAGSSLVCVGEIPDNALVYILTGDADALIRAAAKVAQACGTAGRLALAFDCISRVLFLRERYSDEATAISQSVPPDLPIVGALTLGEIAHSDAGCLEFYNKTVVVGRLY